MEEGEKEEIINWRRMKRRKNWARLSIVDSIDRLNNRCNENCQESYRVSTNPNRLWNPLVSTNPFGLLKVIFDSQPKWVSTNPSTFFSVVAFVLLLLHYYSHIKIAAWCTPTPVS